MGVDVDTVNSAVFAIASALGGLSGLLVGMYYNHIDPAMSFQATLKGVVAQVIGGVGSKAGPRVLTGQIRRGTGEELAVVLWSSDLRGFTARSDRLPGDRMIVILNALFEAQAKAIREHGGEILKFIGDGLLAIFPIDNVSIAAVPARNTLSATSQALRAVQDLADDPSMMNEPPLEIVIALRIGTAIYGNIGAADRLDFTVIGLAVNLVNRIEAIAKSLKLPIVVSDEFARMYGRPLQSLGHHELRGLSKVHELFSPLEEA
jgi:adenylate cyclase